MFPAFDQRVAQLRRALKALTGRSHTKPYLPEADIFRDYRASDFVAVFGCMPDQLIPPIKSISQSLLPFQPKSSRIDSGCICKDLLENIIASAHRRDLRNDHDTAPLLSTFIAASSYCHICNFLRWHVRRQHRRNGYHEGAYEHCQDKTVSIDFCDRESRAIRKEVFGMRNDDHLLSFSAGGIPLAEFTLMPVTDDLNTADDQYLRECEKHEECSTAESKLLPRRVLDVGSEAEPSLRLHITLPEEQGRYIALSYCWGGYNSIKLTKSQLNDFQQGLEEVLLPQTYRDAISVTRKSGVRHLCIDALCILQDSETDWQSECGRMDRVYGDAVFTICASNASNASSAIDGFLGDRNIRDISYAYCGMISHGEMRWPVYLAERLQSGITNLACPTEGHLRGEPLTPRGWTVQERLLSRRILYFTSKRMIWQCRRGTWTEDGISAGPQKGLQTNSLVSGVQQWYQIVEGYSYCGLAKPSDRLPALSGIASALRARTQMTYLHGHWEQDLFWSLMWHRWHKGRNPEHQAPSWSWASMNGGVSFGPMGSPSPDSVSIASLLRGRTIESIPNSPKGSTAERLWIRAPVATASLYCLGNTVFIDSTDHDFLELDRFPHARIPVSVILDNEDLACRTTKKCTAVILHERSARIPPARSYSGLLLETSSSGVSDLQRIGTFATITPSPRFGRLYFRQKNISII